jgi:hypothetical protein
MIVSIVQEIWKQIRSSNHCLRSPEPDGLTPAGPFCARAMNERFDACVNDHAADLASPRDRWLIARLREPSGAWGHFFGHALVARAR